MALSLVVVISFWILAAGSVIAIAFREEIVSAWREPVLAAPVLIIESDDWGYGPVEQGARLGEIASTLGRYRDRTGRPPVMTLGIVLAGPDTRRIAADDCRVYYRLTLSDPALHPVLTAMEAGARQGIFSLQLHGMEHFWPSAVLEAAKRDQHVREWLVCNQLPKTEELPPALQSRWIDGVELPSQALSEFALCGAAKNEVDAFATIFGRLPAVVVPPTFVWPSSVERAWAAAGLRAIVTPGRRYGGRDARGMPVDAGSRFYNSQRSTEGLMYLVRDVYFEPERGHTASSALASLVERTRLGMPTLLETHRSNFVADEQTRTNSLTEMDGLLSAALALCPGVRFMSSTELTEHYAACSSLIERRLLPKLHCFLLRLAKVPRLRKLALGTGVAVPAGLLCWMTKGSRWSATA